MHEDRIVLQRLHEVGHERILEQDGHRAGGTNVARGHRLAVAGFGDNDVAKPALEVGKVAGQAEDGHHFRGDRDVETVLARKPIRYPSQRGHDVAERAVIHVHHTAPEDTPWINAERIAPVDMIVDHCCQQIVGCGYRVKVTGEMEIDVLHGHDLRMAATSRTSLHAKAGSERGLADAADRLAADAVQSVGQAHGGRGLALTRRGWGNGRDQDQLALRPVGQRVHEVQGDLCLMAPIGMDCVHRDPSDARDFADGFHRCRARDFKIVLQMLFP